MEDFPVMLLFLIVYLISAASGGKKKKKKKSGPMRSRAQGEQRDARAAGRDRQTMAGFGEAFSGQSDAQHPCDMDRIHLHEADQAQFALAAEGEDPCHAGGQTAQDESAFEPEQAGEREALKQDVLRGVVMSEILMRPHERAAMRRGRR